MGLHSYVNVSLNSDLLNRDSSGKKYPKTMFPVQII